MCDDVSDISCTVPFCDHGYGGIDVCACDDVSGISCTVPFCDHGYGGIGGAHPRGRARDFYAIFLLFCLPLYNTIILKIILYQLTTAAATIAFLEFALLAAGFVAAATRFATRAFAATASTARAAATRTNFNSTKLTFLCGISSISKLR